MYIIKTNKGKLHTYLDETIAEVKKSMAKHIKKGKCSSYKIYETSIETYEKDYRDLGGEL